MINKVDKQVTTLLANMTLETDHNEIYSTPSIDVTFVHLLTSPQKVAMTPVKTVYER